MSSIYTARTMADTTSRCGVELAVPSLSPGFSGKRPTNIRSIANDDRTHERVVAEHGGGSRMLTVSFTPTQVIHMPSHANVR